MNVTATLFGQMATFAVLVWFVHRYLWGPVTQAMEARTRRIADGLAAAERGTHELESAKKRSAEELRKARQDAGEIIATAHKQAGEVVEEAKEEARTEGQRQLEAAKAEIELEKSRAREQLRGEVVSLAMVSAEKVLAREIDVTAHNDFIAKMIQQL
ncbi:MAG: F0F1 ATP synthase subunit B [Beggiatoa sp. IS2]|nr:MAG: F0F1 ATP synthase subunit B [Beggiatoa sp. IS2]